MTTEPNTSDAIRPEDVDAKVQELLARTNALLEEDQDVDS